MFKRMQLRMTLYYSGILMLIILGINITTYITLNQINQSQMSDETRIAISDIKDSEWREVPHSDSSESSEDSGTEHEIPSVKPATIGDSDLLKVPPALNSFFFYYIYDSNGNIIESRISSTSLDTYLKKKSETVLRGGHASLIRYDDGKELYLMAVKLPIIHNGNTVGEVYAGRDVTAAFETIDRLIMILFATSGIGILLSLIVGYFIAGKSIQPIKDAYEAKQRFIADASHEIRTPLSVMRLSLDVLDREIEESDEFSKQVVEDLVEETDLMSSLIENLLEVARHDTGKMNFEMKSFNLSNEIKKACDSLKNKAKEKAIDIIDNSPQELVIYGDEKWISRVVSILLDNAIKYTPSGGRITIDSGGAAGSNGTMSTYFKVSDNGIGISEPEIKKIFERFYRADSSRAKKTGGHGLGLSIAKDVIEEHGGKIEAESSPDAGSTFTVTLPSGSPPYEARGMEKKHSNKSILHNSFEIGIILKGIDGILEIIGGILLAFIPPDRMHSLVKLITQHELSEDPNDLVMNFLLKAMHGFSVESQHFAVFYLAFHGIIKVFLVDMLLKKRRWAYPMTIVFLAIFMAYQMYRYTLGHSIWMIALSLFDAVIIWLAIIECKRIRQSQ